MRTENRKASTETEEIPEQVMQPASGQAGRSGKGGVKEITGCNNSSMAAMTVMAVTRRNGNYYVQYGSHSCFIPLPFITTNTDPTAGRTHLTRCPVAQ
jgi:hypothetical protein